MEVNEKKLARQLGIVQKWVQNKAIGTLEAVTAFGKTYTAILAIKRLQIKYPDATINVVLPGRDLADDWNDPNRGHIVQHSLKNVRAMVVNTYIRYEHVCDLLILDEIHNYAATEFRRVFEQTTYTFCLGLTATLERIDGKHEMLQELCPIFDTVSLAEAKREGYVSDFNIYNWGLELSHDDQQKYDGIHSTFNNCFAYFKHSFPLAMACSFGKDAKSQVEEEWKTGGEWRLWFAKQQEWDETSEHFYSPANISKKAQQWKNAMVQRKSFIYTASIKIDAIEELVEKFPCKTIIFSENHKFANDIEERLGSKRCRAYHTYLETQVIDERVEKYTKKQGLVVSYRKKKLGKDTLKRMILEDFKKPDGISVLAAVKAVDEGYDNDQIQMGIQASYSSSKRQNTQRTGRGIRKDENNLLKSSLIINLYIKGTQEEKWLKEKQKGTQGIMFVESIEEINRSSYGGITF